MTTCGSVEDKMRWAFKMYDTDGSGANKYEILKVELGLTGDKDYYRHFRLRGGAIFINIFYFILRNYRLRRNDRHHCNFL